MPLSTISLLSLRVGFVAATVIAAVPASAQVAHFYGTGAGMSCGEYLHGRQTRTDAQMRVVVEWVRGYMSGFTDWCNNWFVVLYCIHAYSSRWTPC